VIRFLVPEYGVMQEVDVYVPEEAHLAQDCCQTALLGTKRRYVAAITH
jgi:hypothetical protein